MNLNDNVNFFTMEKEYIEKLDTVHEKVNDIHKALVGNDYHDGLISKVNEIEKTQNTAKRYFWMGAGGVGLGGILSHWKTIKGFFEL